MKPPNGLKPRGRAFWHRILKDYELRGDELQILTEACRVLDRLNELRVVLNREGLMAAGAKGQRIVHPVLVEERLQRLTLARLLGALGVPPAAQGAEEVEGIPSIKSARARRAARARWGELG